VVEAVFDQLPLKHIVGVDSEFHFGGHDTFEEAARSGERPFWFASSLRSCALVRSGSDLLTSWAPSRRFPLGRMFVYSCTTDPRSLDALKLAAPVGI
jgi:hypothetical protein